jgi:hypothetical protein
VRRYQAVVEADVFMKRFADTICHHVTPGEAVKLLDASKLVGPAGPETREAAKLLSLAYSYSGHAQLLHTYIDLSQVCARDLPTEMWAS